MKKFLFSLAIMALTIGSADAQKYFTRSGKISFYSDTPMEKIEAKNGSATSVLDTESGKMEFAVLIKGFQFAKSLMQDHFNENYMESSKYPKALFKGEISNIDDVDFGHDGQLPTANCQLPTANCQLPTANCQLPTANCQLPTANCQLPIPVLLSTYLS